MALTKIGANLSTLVIRLGRTIAIEGQALAGLFSVWSHIFGPWAWIKLKGVDGGS